MHQKEKLSYLDTAPYSTDMVSSIDTDVDRGKLRHALMCYNEATNDNGISENDALLILRQLDAVLQFSDAEWARLQVRILLPELKSSHLEESDLFFSDIDLLTLIRATFYERTAIEGGTQDARFS